MYLLDTNVLSEIVRRRPDTNVVTRFENAREGELFTSVICLEEIHFGIRTGPNPELVRERMERDVFSRVAILVVDEMAARTAGELRGNWKIAGTPVGYRDGLIVATAKAYGLILVTRNVRHFDHVAGLRIENWFAPPETA